MTRMVLFLCLISLIFAIGAVAQEEPPEAPFKTVHFVKLDAAQEGKLAGALAQLNAALSKAGYPNAQYRLYKVAGRQQGPYSHIWEASWSGRAEYEKVHKLSLYHEASSLLEEMTPFMKDEVYNRFVEIPTKK